jgi:chemotaxis methyl-accepting protein methylase
MNEKNNINTFLKIFPKLKLFEKDFILFVKNILIYFKVIDKETLNKKLEIEIYE